MANVALGLTSQEASGSVAHYLDTSTNYTSGKLFSLRNNAVEKLSVAYDGIVTTPGVVASSNTSLVRDANNAAVVVSGGTSGSAGANLNLYGGAHATLAGDVQFRADTTNVLYYDHSATTWTVTGTTVLATGVLFLNETAHGALTNGIVVNQGINDDLILAFKSSDVATALTTAVSPTVETDDFFGIAKESAGSGGVRLLGLAEDAASVTSFSVHAWGGTASTNKTTATARGLIEFRAFEHDGANAVADVTADGNVLAVFARVGGATVARMMVDEDGDMYSVTAAQTFDEHDDLALLNHYDIVRRDDLRRAHAEWASEYEDELIRLGVLGGPVSEGGMTNVTQLQRLMVGALRQVSGRLEQAEEKLKLLEA